MKILKLLRTHIKDPIKKINLDSISISINRLFNTILNIYYY